MLKSRRITSLLMVLVLMMSLLSFVGCGKKTETAVPNEKKEATSSEKKSNEASKKSSDQAATEPIKIKLAHYAEKGHPADVAANEFASKVNKRTNGSVIIEIFPVKYPWQS